MLNQDSGERKIAALTVTIDPKTKVRRGLIAPIMPTSSPKSRSRISGPSPASRTTGIKTTEHRRLVYQLKCNAFPLTISRLFLMTTACNAVTALLPTPNATPTEDTDTPSIKMPMRNPRVTIEQDKRMSVEGLEWRNKYDMATVIGRTRPRAT